MLKRLLVAATTVVLATPVAALAATDATAPSPDDPHDDGTYLVQLADEPVATYEGAVRGLKATKPAEGATVDRTQADVVKYVKHLDGRRNAILARVKGEKKLYDYNFTFTGFAAKLTGKQVAVLAATPGVVSVIKDEPRPPRHVHHAPTCSASPARTASGSGSSAARQGRRGRDRRHHRLRALAREPQLRRAARRSADRRHDEEAVQGRVRRRRRAPRFTCNNKVIGGRYFVRASAPDKVIQREFLSPRDFGGHGSHTASTAAGNVDVPAVVDGDDLGKASRHRPSRPDRGLQGLLGPR